jgi:hypothetical protein
LLAEGKVKFVGNRKAFDELRSSLVTFVPDFELIPGTKSKTKVPAAPAKDPLEAPEPASSAGV